jgi:NAD(P)H-dependent FMN reductase
VTAPRLHIITTSTRPGRLGPSIARWFDDFARGHGRFDARLIDLAEFDLPVFDEAHHPRMQQYEHEHTLGWSASVDAADAYVFVMPEYNHNPPPSFINALDYLHKEWNYKPAGFVSYSIGATGGIRAAQAAKPLVTTMKMMPMLEGVMVPMAGEQIDAAGVFNSNRLIDDSARVMLDELLYWANGLKAMRAGKAEKRQAA